MNARQHLTEIKIYRQTLHAASILTFPRIKFGKTETFISRGIFEVTNLSLILNLFHSRKPSKIPFGSIVTFEVN